MFAIPLVGNRKLPIKPRIWLRVALVLMDRDLIDTHLKPIGDELTSKDRLAAVQAIGRLGPEAAPIAGR